MSPSIEPCNNTSVGMVIRKGNEVLLIERKKPPYGFAAPAGHVENGEEYELAAKRELSEEVGIKAETINLVAEGKRENKCRRPGGSWHYWKVYEVTADDDSVTEKSDEVRQSGWYSREEISKLAQKTEKYLDKKISENDWEHSPGLEPIWYEWFKLLNII
jgi:ADP-ribose pyrophosphatase YjhB (NUDIX family)